MSGQLPVSCLPKAAERPPAIALTVPPAPKPRGLTPADGPERQWPFVAVCAVSSVGLAVVYYVQLAWLSALFPTVLLVLCGVAVVLVRARPGGTLARCLVGYGLSLAALGCHWSSGGIAASHAAACWAHLGPQFLILSKCALLLCCGCRFGVGDMHVPFPMGTPSPRNHFQERLLDTPVREDRDWNM